MQPTQEDLQYAWLTLAAPDLLAALQALLDLHIAHHNNPLHAVARAAIRKATTGDIA